MIFYTIAIPAAMGVFISPPPKTDATGQRNRPTYSLHRSENTLASGNFGVRCSVFGVKISNTEHRTPNVEMKLECLNVEVVAELGVFTQPGEKIGLKQAQ